ncbi:MAG: ribonuclease catalytic domain-containing protein, partial [Actinomycetota bacterium]|nr:ribonuclease catalytic domain-containing protein [Actinomycetota bacterium]
MHKGRGRARIDRVLGPADRIDVVLEGLLVQEGELRGFEPYDPPPITIEGRVDLREELSFTIDPETAKDFDDALTITEDRAYVHIADVSYFVPAGSPLDRGAQERAFSVYVPGLVSPMLPPELSEELCSLRPHTDRLCLTVEVPLKGGLPVGEPQFYRSVIRSRERLTYSQAQAILRGRERADADLTEALRRAERLATALRDLRFSRGALRIESGEVAFAFNGKGGVERAWRETEPQAHMLIEELMILANELVAGLLAGRRREALYRVHEPPEPQSVQLMLARLADLGVPTPPAPKQIGPSEAAAVAGAASESVTAYLKRSGRGRDAFPPLVLQALKQAHYDPHNLGHMGLASTAYCHFTSPIRRYSDSICHRALLRELGLSDEPLPEDLAEADEEAGDDHAGDLAVEGRLPAELEEALLEQPGKADLVGLVLELRGVTLSDRRLLGDLGEILRQRLVRDSELAQERAVHDEIGIAADRRGEMAVGGAGEAHVAEVVR